MDQEKSSEVLLAKDVYSARWHQRKSRRTLYIALSLSAGLTMVALISALARLSPQLRSPSSMTPASSTKSPSSHVHTTSTTHSSLPVQTMQAEPEEFYHCGKNIDSALDNGCIYDAMLAAWVPEPCFNKTLYDEYAARHHDWQFFRDDIGRNEVRFSLVETGRYTQLFTGYPFHVQHCAYLLHKLLVAVHSPIGLIEDGVKNAKHGTHCAKILAGIGKDEGIVSTIVMQSFLKCRKLRIGI